MFLTWMRESSSARPFSSWTKCASAAVTAFLRFSSSRPDTYGIATPSFSVQGFTAD